LQATSKSPEVQATGEGECTTAELRQWVIHAFELAGFTEDPEVGLVQMAATLEGRLGECLAKAAELPPGVAEEREKAREKERRQVDCDLDETLEGGGESLTMAALDGSLNDVWQSCPRVTEDREKARGYWQLKRILQTLNSERNELAVGGFVGSVWQRWLSYLSGVGRDGRGKGEAAQPGRLLL